MPRYVAFLRGMNLGKRRLPMSRLRTIFIDSGFTEVETFIASGNVLFTSKLRDMRKLEGQISRQLEKSLGYQVDTFVRTTDEVAAIGQSKVFPEEGEAGITVHVGFLHEELPPDVARRLTSMRSKEDAFRVLGREYFWLCRVRSSDSKVWASPELKALRLPSSSMRNMTSIRKLIAKHLS